jgi:hypothetical protein
MVISCTVEYIQLTIHTVYRIVQLGPNPVHDTSKPNLHLNCIAKYIWTNIDISIGQNNVRFRAIYRSERNAKPLTTSTDRNILIKNRK